MESLVLDLGARSYEIVIAGGSLDSIGQRLSQLKLGQRVFVISNPTVFSIYGGRVINSLKKAGFSTGFVLIPDGEEYKSLSWLSYILTELLKGGLDRKSALVALGGGVIGDMTGFAASIYMRGIDYVAVPTTLLSQVDSSVGGKTGVNHQLGKNMIGTFYQPRIVFIDTDTLQTLPKRETISGIGEVIKYGVIKDKEFFHYLKNHREQILNKEDTALTHIIKRSCQIKAEVVSFDERESGLREILNFGHTIGHAIESVTGYMRYLHGEAVAIGMNFESRLSVKLGLFDEKQSYDIMDLIESYGLPATITSEKLSVNSLLDAMSHDKKAESGSLKFVLPEKIGTVKVLKGINREDIASVLKG
ncbi:3-dehydroquinate synthase [Candidatus Magnetomonas plexicatena]|uniref:3-dehydroquinate synthase n=1 Tax=Candidatus Magnetomonas plexicatena TaxID=2552947 RepID=UPI001C764B28|nr:3-dehydroquinate synthase [Nitrospirales bacterium LBB_01]